MSKKNIIARVGNFEITKEESPYYSYLRIKSVSGHWSVSYRDDNEMYGKLIAMIGNPKYAKTLEYHILHLFYTTTTMMDEEFANDYFSALERMRDRMAARIPNPTEEEEDAALAEAETMEEIKKMASIEPG